MLKVLIATGGTGGHLFPSMQLAKMLDGQDVLFAGYKLKTSSFFDRSFAFKEILSTHSKKRGLVLLKGFFQALKLIYQFSPDVVVGFGSYHSFPVLLAALALRKKIVLFEANVSLGKVNRFFSPFAEKIAFQFPISHKKGVYVPLLPWHEAKKSKGTYLKKADVTTILVFGGSQGAVVINEMFFQAAQEIDFPVRILHFTGKTDKKYEYKTDAIVKEFEEDMKSAYQVADFAICRAGAGTCAELIQHKLPAILIPYPFAYDHQRKNGEFLRGSVRIVPQTELTPKHLKEEITQMRKNLSKYKKAYHSLQFFHTEPFAEIVRTVGENR